MKQQVINSVVIIGSGNLAEALARAISASGITLAGIVARNEERGREVASLASSVWYSAVDQAPESDLYLISVSDRAVEEVASSPRIPASAIIAHTAGCVSIDALYAHPNRAVFYPLQTFTRGRAVDFSDLPLFVECSSEEVYAAVEAFAHRLSRVVNRADSARRRKIHLAGVFANNFANHVFHLGREVLASADLGYDILKPIMRETLSKALEAYDPAQVQTGPAVRGDSASMERHLELIDNETIRDIYKSISKSIWETSKKI